MTSTLILSHCYYLSHAQVADVALFSLSVLTLQNGPSYARNGGLYSLKSVPIFLLFFVSSKPLELLKHSSSVIRIVTVKQYFYPLLGFGATAHWSTPATKTFHAGSTAFSSNPNVDTTASATSYASTTKFGVAICH